MAQPTPIGQAIDLLLNPQNPENATTPTSLPSDNPDRMTEQQLAEAERKAQELQERREREKARQRQEHIDTLQHLLQSTVIYQHQAPDLADQEIYNLHARLLVACANKILEKHNRRFIIDDTNRDILRFLLYYFNNSPLALQVFPDRPYALDKNILLVGSVGVGKTLIMDAFALYLDKTNNYHSYTITSQTQMLNHYKQHNNIDRFTFNTSERNTFEGKPFNLCLNDIGLKTQRFYGNDTEVIIEEFLYARYEIWEQYGKRTHLTTNLEKSELQTLFSDEHGRLKDRLKMFNVLPLDGESRR